MDPNIWGPKMWFVLHTMSFAYPENPTDFDKENYNNFFNSLTNMIPCTVCKAHYTEHTKKNPIAPHLHSKNSLVKYVVELHNEVNKILGKEILDERVALQNIVNKYNQNKKWTKIKNTIKKSIPTIKIISICIILILISIYAYKKLFSKRRYIKTLKGNKKIIKQGGGRNAYANYYRNNY